jgi:Cupin domain
VTAELTALVGARVVGEHRHPALVERFAPVEGELTVKRNGQTSILHQGETAVIDPGVWLDWWNAGERDARVRVEITHGERLVHMMETFFGLAARVHRLQRHTLSAATRAVCAGVQRRDRVPFAAAGRSTYDLLCASTDRALAWRLRDLPAALAHRVGASDVAASVEEDKSRVR